MCLRTLIPVQVATRAMLENPLSSVACHIFTASLPLMHRWLSFVSGAFPPGATNLSTAVYLANAPGAETFKFVAYHSLIDAASDESGAAAVLHHPDTAAARDHIIYQDHVPTDNGTASSCIHP